MRSSVETVSIKKCYLRTIDSFFDQHYTVAIDDLVWYNVYPDGEYQELHDHLGDPLVPARFSCIHFLSYDKKNIVHHSSKILFTNSQFKSRTR